MMDYLKRRGRFADPKASPRPGLILLDLNMPKMDGRKGLLYLKSDPDLKWIPVLVLSTSIAPEDVVRCYNLGANSFIRKPVDLTGFEDLAVSVKAYWLGLVQLPFDEQPFL
jgi:CheY-like chemotaxis protein